MKITVYKKTKDIKVRFLGATLLSMSEVLELQERITSINKIWLPDSMYLRNEPGDYKFDLGLKEDEDGEEKTSAGVLIYNIWQMQIEKVAPDWEDPLYGFPPATRPALIIDQEYSNVETGDKITIGLQSFTVISEKYALMDGCLNEDPDWLDWPDSDNFDENSTRYENSNIKCWIDEWYNKLFA